MVLLRRPRCYRYGQTKPVEVYRLVMGKSLESKMHKRQVRFGSGCSRWREGKGEEGAGVNVSPSCRRCFRWFVLFHVCYFQLLALVLSVPVLS